jgi:O-methyltransferase
MNYRSSSKLAKNILPDFVRKIAKILLRYSNVVILPDRPSYDEDGFATIHNADFRSDPDFSRAYALGLQTGSWAGVQWRGHVYTWFALQAYGLEGDFVECGVNRGGFARMVFDYTPLKNSRKKFYLLDTYCGFVAESLNDKEVESGIPTAYDYGECYEDVVRTFSPFPNAVIVRGRVPDTLSEVKTSKVAFLSIDMNCAEPETAAANYFWDRLVPGAFMLLDDYGHPRHYEQKLAFDQFAREKGVKILSLPTEQAVIQKPQGELGVIS